MLRMIMLDIIGSLSIEGLLNIMYQDQLPVATALVAVTQILLTEDLTRVFVADKWLAEYLAGVLTLYLHSSGM